MKDNENGRVAISFAAIDQYVERNIPSPKETLLTGKDRVLWGENNLYPEFLLELSKTVPSLRSVIGGTVDFIVGDDLQIRQLGNNEANLMNTRGDTIRAQVAAIARDYEIYGGFALQVIRAKDGSVAEIYYCDMRYLRSNKKNTVFYYSEKWAQRSQKIVTYPAFFPYTKESWARLEDNQKERAYSSILFVKADGSQVYPFPVYGAAIKACETERCIDDYHLNAINNGFTGSMFVNFNNGIPSDQMKEEIEADFTEKFSGHQNAGRIGFSWNPNKDAAVTFTEMKTEDFGEKYKALATHVRQQIFTAFRANPNLFGIPTESLGFSQEEYESAFRLYNRTMVRPVQRIICDAYDRIYGEPGVLTIKPFTMEETKTETNVN